QDHRGTPILAGDPSIVTHYPASGGPLGVLESWDAHTASSDLFGHAKARIGLGVDGDHDVRTGGTVLVLLQPLQPLGADLHFHVDAVVDYRLAQDATQFVEMVDGDAVDRHLGDEEALAIFDLGGEHFDGCATSRQLTGGRNRHRVEKPFETEHRHVGVEQRRHQIYRLLHWIFSWELI